MRGFNQMGRFIWRFSRLLGLLVACGDIEWRYAALGRRNGGDSPLATRTSLTHVYTQSGLVFFWWMFRSGIRNVSNSTLDVIQYESSYKNALRWHFLFEVCVPSSNVRH